MNRTLIALSIVLPALCLPTMAMADDMKMAPTAAAGSTLPAICTKDAMDMPATPMPMGGMDKAHQALMAGMPKMDDDMNKGMMAKDVDVAFICGMLPHHQGAIDMAKADMQYGKDPFARTLAKAIIAAQEKEIAEMQAWLKKHGE